MYITALILKTCVYINAWYTIIKIDVPTGELENASKQASYQEIDMSFIPRHSHYEYLEPESVSGKMIHERGPLHYYYIINSVLIRYCYSRVAPLNADSPLCTSTQS